MLPSIEISVDCQEATEGVEPQTLGKWKCKQTCVCADMCVCARAQVLRLDSVWVISAVFLTTTMSGACPRSAECSLAPSASSRNSSFATAWFMLSGLTNSVGSLFFFFFHTHIFIFFHSHIQQVSVMRLVAFIPTRQETVFFLKRQLVRAIFGNPEEEKKQGTRGLFFFF